MSMSVLENVIQRSVAYCDLYTPRLLHRVVRRAQYKGLGVQTLLPDMFWTEKILICIDYLQLYGLLWNVANPWPWPYIWLHWTRYLVLANGDWFSLTENGAVLGRTASINVSKWGELTGYSSIPLYYTIGSVGLCVMFAVALYLAHRSTHGLKRIFVAVSIYLYYICYLAFLPVALSVFRLYYCENGVLAVDPSIQCLGPAHTQSIEICSIIVLPMIIGLPILVTIIIKNSIVYRYNNADHEKYLQIQELSYIMGLSDDYITTYLASCSSFTLSGIYYRPAMLALKITLLIVYIFCRSNLILQGALYITITLAFVFRYTVTCLPFRCPYSNLIHAASMVALFINTSVAAMNSFGVENALLVGSVESYILLCINFACLCVCAACVGFAFASQSAVYPPLRTIATIITSPSLLRHVVRWLKDIRQADDVLYSFLHTPVEVTDIVSLEGAIRCIHSDWLEARVLGSIFQNILTDRLVTMQAFHASKAALALRRYFIFTTIASRKLTLIYRDESWDKEYRRMITDRSAEVYHRKHVLMPPKKRRILLKLLATRAWLMPMANRPPKPPTPAPPDEENCAKIDELTESDIKETDELVGGPEEGNAEETLEHWNDFLNKFEDDVRNGSDEYADVTPDQVDAWYAYRDALVDIVFHPNDSEDYS